MFGRLHIEKATFKVLGEWLEASGWIYALSQADVSKSGTADSLLTAIHVTETHRAHQITACALYILLQAAYNEYTLECLDDNFLDFESWCGKMTIEKLHFLFWYMALMLELNILTFVRSVRESNFTLYLASLAKRFPCFFAMNRTHFTRWLPVHLRDMKLLHVLSPSTEAKFQEGQYAVYKTFNKFSALAVDHAHD